jgi:hypothetical protein
MSLEIQVASEAGLQLPHKRLRQMRAKIATNPRTMEAPRLPTNLSPVQQLIHGQAWLRIEFPL